MKVRQMAIAAALFIAGLGAGLVVGGSTSQAQVGGAERWGYVSVGNDVLYCEQRRCYSLEFQY